MSPLPPIAPRPFSLADLLRPPLKAYLFVFFDSNPFMTKEAFTNFFDTRQEILNWLAFFPNSIAIVSRKNCIELREIINKQFPSTHFILAKLDYTQVDGWANPKIWEFIKDPKSSGKWE